MTQTTTQNGARTRGRNKNDDGAQAPGQDDGRPPEGGLIESKTTTTTLKVQPLKISRTVIVVRGVSPLIVHAWSEKAKRQMLEKQTSGKRAGKKDLKDPNADFLASRYLDAEGHECIRSASFAKSLVSAARWTEMRMTEVRGVFFVLGELLKIHDGEGKPATGAMREDMVRVFGGTADIRFRACYENWSIDLPIEYNANAISPQQLYELVNLAGFSVGVAEWRPEKGGQYGRYAVDLDATSKVGDLAQASK